MQMTYALLLSYLSESDRVRLSGMMIEVAVPSGKMLMEQGASGNSFFVLLEGGAEVLRDRLCVRRLGKGSCCGELSMMTGQPCTATVLAVEDCRVLTASAKVFQLFFGQRVAAKRADWLPFLRALPIFGDHIDEVRRIPAAPPAARGA